MNMDGVGRMVVVWKMELNRNRMNGGGTEFILVVRIKVGGSTKKEKAVVVESCWKKLKVVIHNYV
jgi:hypothetical protein